MNSEILRDPVFELTIDDVFEIAGRGLIVTGTVSRGAVRVGAALSLISSDGQRHAIRIATIEGFRRLQQEAVIGESVGLTIEGAPRDAVKVGSRVTFE